MAYLPLMEAISRQYAKILGRNLVGIYIHGSIAFGCFNPQRSDIDFIVVVERGPSRQTKLRLLDVLERLLPDAPKKGFEMSVVLRRHCERFVYPTPYELHFSSACLDRYRSDPLSLCGGDEKTDYDLAAHFTVIRHTGIVQAGESIEHVFGNVPRAYYLDSIRRDISGAAGDALDNPVCAVLNLCRVLAFIRDGIVLSKAGGGEWGIRNLPAQYTGVAAEALACYNAASVPQISGDGLAGFCEYMLGQIFCKHV